MEFLTLLLCLLLVTRTFGELAERVGQPALIGELVSGILLGVLATQLDLESIEGLTEDRVFRVLTDLGVFVLMLQAGIHMQPRELAQVSGSGVVIALGGLVLPFGLGFVVADASLPESSYHFAQCLFVGTALAVTAVPVAVRVLMDLGLLESSLGRIVVSSAIIDDVLSLLLLAVLTGVVRTGEVPDALEILVLVGRILGFFLVAGAIGHFVFPRVGRWIGRAKLDEFEFSSVLVVGLIYSGLAELAGLHFILGAFLAGLFFRRSTIDDEAFRAVERRVAGISTGFLAPIFFASIGLQFDWRAIVAVPGFVSLIIGIALLGKIIGCGLTARASGLSWVDSSAVGVAMSARGAVELIIADVALQAGLFQKPDPPPPVVEQLFSTVVLMAIVTTWVAPWALRAILRQR